jgi:hypothetical protein
MNRMAFGDIAVTIKALPNVVRGSEVQITGCGVVRGKLQYSAALYNSNGEFKTFIGPFPDTAFGFRRDPSPAEAEALLQLVVNGGEQRPKRKPKSKSVPEHDSDF